MKYPEAIAMALIGKIINIIEKIAPSKVINVKKNQEPWRNSEVDSKIQEFEHQLETDIESNDVEEWRYLGPYTTKP